MSLAEVAALDADGASSNSLSLFVHCSRDSKSLDLQLLDETTLLESQILPSHKPRALDCSGAEYVAAVETALSPVDKDEAPRFEFRWSRSSQTLTLMERAGFAMKFSSIKFHRSEGKLSTLLHLVAQRQKQSRETIREKEEEFIHFERLLKQKEELLEAALTQKQKREDTLFQGFCAVLNAKKDEIKRLQNELERAQKVGKYEMKAKKKLPAGKRPRKVTGAKLKKLEDEDMSDGSKESDDDSTVAEGEEDDEIQKKRSKRDAISAYSQVPVLRSSSVQISSAEDLLSSMDDIIKNEEETDEAVLRGTSSPDVKSEPARTRAAESAKLRSSSRTKKAAPVKKAASPQPKQEPEPVEPPRAAPIDEPMDSEEEDILDMLS